MSPKCTKWIVVIPKFRRKTPWPPISVPRFARETVATSIQQCYKGWKKCYKHFNSAHHWCHSAKPSHIISSTYAWSRWISFSHSRVFGFSRELKDTSATDPPILAREYRYARSQRIKISLFFQCSIFPCNFLFDADVTLAGPSLSLIRPDSYYCINTD